MKSKAWIIVAVLLLCGIIVSSVAWNRAYPATAPDERFHISAAISLRTVLEEARPILAKAAGMPVEFNFASSGALAAQIVRGAPVDIFISADHFSVDTLAAKRLVTPDGAAVLATNELVLVVPAGSQNMRSLDDLRRPEVHRIAIGDPDSVPAGRYARQTLEHAGLWSALATRGQLVMGENVAQVLAYVTAGEVDAGFVYRSDVPASMTKARVVLQVPAQAHAPIEYISAVLTEAPQPHAAAAVQKALLSSPVQSILAAHGFGPVTNASSPTTNQEAP
jgi:molybdate transport system substrate-binding protein